MAHRGHGFVFLDGTMAPDEERVTLAHEVAHFIRHYERPRFSAIQRIGSSVLDALDGDRPLTPAERVAGALRDVSLGIYQHALSRNARGIPDAVTLKLEREADLLGFELLAPSTQVARSSLPGGDCNELLQTAYGFPPDSALAWARWIDGRRAKEDGVISRIRHTAKKSDLAVE
ncbi:MAG: ImmA/IrrE family metallo-endopeptidase [Caulobacteraceae bacterium]|nr:ImmA/IrrE family metallo-endopeptidase [Caulobacteraceae bacterium]